MAIDSQQFRSALGSFATGITIVTTRDKVGRDVGLTVNSFNSVSLDPPMVLWSLAKKSQTRQAFIQAGYFAVHILAADQSELATRFASRMDRFSGLVLERGEKDIPLLQGCAARFQCKTVSRYEGGDHDIFVGEVVSFEHFDRPTLVFLGGRYAVALEKPDLSGQGTTTSSDLGRNTLGYLFARTYYHLRVRLRPELARLNLTEADSFILAALALNSPCTAAELADLVGVSGYQMTQQDMMRLAQRNLIDLRGSGDAGQVVQLADAGTKIVLNIASMSAAIESDAVTDLSYTEIELLKQMLRKIIRRTKAPWQKDPLVLESSGVEVR